MSISDDLSTEIVSGIVVPSSQNNLTLVFIDVKVTRPGGFHLQRPDFAKEINVTFDISTENIPQLEFGVKKKFMFDGIPSNRIEKLNLAFLTLLL